MGVVILLSCVGVAGIAAWLLMRKALQELESACRCTTYSDGSCTTYSDGSCATYSDGSCTTYSDGSTDAAKDADQ